MILPFIIASVAFLCMPIITYLTYSAQYKLMTTESDSNRSKEPKNRGEVYKQEQQRIAEESHMTGSGEPREPNDRGEVQLRTIPNND